MKNDIKLLYVEDNEDIRTQYADFFSRKVEKLYTASNGLEGLELYETHLPDIIVTDIKMPVMDGIEMITSIRKTNSKVPIIVTSAFSDQDYLLQAINAGVTKYIIKPFNRNNIKTTIDETIEYLTLKKSEQKIQNELKAIYDISRDGIAIVDLEGNFLSLNKSFRTMLEYEQGDLLSNNIKLVQTIKDEHGTVQQLLKKAIQDGYVDNVEKIFVTKMGKRIQVNVSMVLMPNKKRILITARNVTKIRNYETIMFEYMTLIDKYIITSRTTLNGTITYASKAFCNITGYSKEELIGQNHRILKHPDTKEEVFQNMWSTILNDKTWHGELKNKKKNGDYYWVKISISPMFDNGKKIGYTSIREDITDKKQLEKISITDPLTGVFNRRYFDKMVPRLLNGAKRKNETISFLMIDIDFFKQYNDTYGHQAGDDVLIKVSTLFKNSLNRADDYCFRLGGEEFGIIFKTNTCAEAKAFANEIKSKVELLKIPHSKNENRQFVTISLGLTCKNANEIDDAFNTYKQTDKLLYKAKQEGRNRVCF